MIMKKLSVIIAAVMLMLSQSVSAQDADKNIFNHMGAGISLGTDGIGLDLSAPITNMFAVRAGISWMPSIKVGANVDYNYNPDDFIKDNVDVTGKVNKFDFKLLFDYYPIKTSTFHITAGAFIGGDKVFEVTNDEQFIQPKKWGTAGVTIGDYFITSDNQGNIKADVKVAKFKPYIGLGFGRALPNESLNLSCDFGVQFWGKPEVWSYANNFGKFEYRKIEKGSGTGDKDGDKAFDILSKIVGYPVLNIRLTGRLF
jgi:hypothetical protein